MAALVTQTLARFAPEAIRAAQNLLGKLASQEAAQVVDLTAQAAASVSTSLTDGGVSQSIHLARQKLLPDLQTLVRMNGQLPLPPEKKIFLDEVVGILSKDGEVLSFEHNKNLRGILEYVVSNPSADADAEVVDEVSKDASTIDDKKTNTARPEEDKPHKPRQQRLYTEEEVEELVQEKLKKLGIGGDGIPQDPIDKILKGVSGIAVGEIKNKNSLFGLLLWGYGKATGNEINRDTVNKFVSSFVDDKFKGKLNEFIEAKVTGKQLGEEFFGGMSDYEKTGVKTVGKLIGLANHVPDWAFDAIAASGQFVDTFAELLHHIPILGGILKIPFMRKFYADLSAFVGRFTATGDLQLISTGAKELKSKLKPTDPK